MAQQQIEKTPRPRKQSQPFMSPEGNGKLRVYNAFPRNYATMAEAIADLDRIRPLGFNAVWMNPLNATSDFTVKRFNKLSFEDQTVKGSLYAAADFSRLNNLMFPDLANNEDEPPAPSTGNPGESSDHEKKLLSAYTDKARENGMQPIFDLVLNHVACDSPLVKGEYPYFQNKNIDTRRWFQEKDPDWDDVVLFNYTDPQIRDEIINELWIPYVTKYINDFGFSGIRMDFAGGRHEIQFVERIVCNQIKRLVADKGEVAIIFAELLPPKEKILLRNIRELRELYTHVTNSTLWHPEHSGHDIGLKQQVTHLMLGHACMPHPLPGGTIGFAASHDDGPNFRNSLKAAAKEAIQTDPYKRHLFDQADKKKKKNELERAITEQVLITLKNTEKLERCILEQRRRLALCALLSDGGFYVLAGDELGKRTPASIFVDEGGRPMYQDTEYFGDAKKQSNHHTTLIKAVNAAMADMPRSTFPHWSQSLHLPEPYNKLVVTMNYNGCGFTDRKPVLSIVNLLNAMVAVTDDFFMQIAEQSRQHNQSLSEEAYQAVLRSQIQLIGHFVANLKLFKAFLYDSEDSESLDESLTEYDASSISRQAAIWDPDKDQPDIEITRSLHFRQGNSSVMQARFFKRTEMPFHISAPLQEQFSRIVLENTEQIRRNDFRQTIQDLKRLYLIYHPDKTRDSDSSKAAFLALHEIIKTLKGDKSAIPREILAILDTITSQAERQKHTH